jgi:hypothetical protein
MKYVTCAMIVIQWFSIYMTGSFRNILLHGEAISLR